MKRKTTKRDTLASARAELTILRRVIGALVARNGGYVDLTAAEIDRSAGDECVMDARRDGVTIRINRKILVVQ